MTIYIFLAMLLQEDEMRLEGGKFAHLNEELHALAEVYGLPIENHQRMSHALTEIQRFLIPVRCAPSQKMLLHKIFGYKISLLSLSKKGFRRI